MEQAAAGGRQFVQDGFPRQFMPEREVIATGHQQAAGNAGIDLIGNGPGDRQQQVGIDDRANHRRHIERGACFWGEARCSRQDRVRGGDRDTLARRRQHLMQEEGIAAGQPVEGAGIPAAAIGELSHRLLGQGVEGHAMDGLGRGQVPQDEPKGMIRANLIVTVGDEMQGLPAIDAPPQEADEVQRGGIGPVRVLPDDHRQLTRGPRGP